LTKQITVSNFQQYVPKPKKVAMIKRVWLSVLAFNPGNIGSGPSGVTTMLPQMTSVLEQTQECFKQASSFLPS
jgi:hypothetical protein